MKDFKCKYCGWVQRDNGVQERAIEVHYQNLCNEKFSKKDITNIINSFYKKNNMKLYKLVLDKKIRKGDKLYIDKTKYITFQYLDGMYSLLIAEDGTPVHLHTSTPIFFKDNKFFVE